MVWWQCPCIRCTAWNHSLMPSPSIPILNLLAAKLLPISDGSIRSDWECRPVASSMAEMMLKFTPWLGPETHSSGNAFLPGQYTARTMLSVRPSWSIRSIVMGPRQAGHSSPSARSSAIACWTSKARSLSDTRNQLRADQARVNTGRNTSSNKDLLCASSSQP